MSESIILLDYNDVQKVYEQLYVYTYKGESMWWLNDSLCVTSSG